MSIFNKKGEGERQTANYATKADVILQRQAELAEKLDKLLAAEGSGGPVAEKVSQETAYISKQNSSILDKLLSENAQLRKEINYVAAQCESVFVKLSGMISSLEEKVMKYALGVHPSESGEGYVPELVNYDKLAESLADKLAGKQIFSDLSCDEIARRVAESMPQEIVPADYIASKVAEQIVIPPAVIGADGSATPVEVSPQIDSDALSDEIARKVSALSPNDFDIIVDDEGCRSLAEAVAEKLDYDGIAKRLAEKNAYDELAAADAEEYVNPEELARLVSEKLAASGVNEDAIADKTAAALSNIMPEVDGDDIADKVASAVLASVPATEIDYDAIVNGVAEKLSASGAVEAVSAETVPIGDDFDIVIDDDGIKKITESVSATVAESTGAKLDEINGGLEKVHAILAEEPAAKDIDELGRKVDDLTERFDELFAPADSDGDYDDEYEDIVQIKDDISDINRQLEEIRALLAGGAVIAAAAAEPAEEPAESAPETDEEEGGEEGEGELVTVSDIVDENEVNEEPADEVMENIFDDVDEQTAEGEAQPDGMEDMEGGVDFANMMKYNRSFIARIIQSSDDVKRYYGQIKNAMLAYRKVNSSVAWGAERFNKGRETIAKLKIRGKTLCLYLNLDPNEYKTSVYHQVDVSDNKSMHGTPMMVKIKSPLGVKKAIRLIDDMLAKRNGEKRHIQERDYASMYPYESIEELIEDGLVKDVSKNK